MELARIGTRMRICLINRYFDFTNAGLGRVGMMIRDELKARGHKVMTISTSGQSLYSYFFYTAAQLPLKLRSEAPRADIYHAITPMEAMWLPKGKSVVTFHDLFQITDSDKLGSGLGASGWKHKVGINYFRLAAKRATRCDRITAVSSKTAIELSDWAELPLDSIDVIPSGINTFTYKEHKTPIKKLGYIGQLDRRKRVDMLVASFKRYAPPELSLDIAGTGPEEPSLNALACGDNRIRFLGRIPDEKLENFYQSLDAFVFPTWVEGYGLPIVEAMACGLPVIVLHDAKLPKEIWNKCVIVGNLDVILGSHNYLNSRCSYVSREANAKWAQAHTWKRAVDAYEQVYEEVICHSDSRKS
jgi:glycosyltransferase involved in cell wall biosynthesis